MENQALELIYSTKDLGLGVFLYTSGHELTGTTLENPRKVILHFSRKKGTDKLILDYFNGTAQAPAKKLFENYRTLRGLIYTRTNNL